MGRFLTHDGNHAPNRSFVLNKFSPQARELVGWWPVHNGGSVIQDYSGFGQHASGANSGVLLVNRFGQRVNQFTAGQDFIVTAGSAAKGLANFTIMVWGQGTSAPSNQSGAVSTYTGAGTDDLLFFYVLRSDGTSIFWNDTTDVVSDATVRNDGLPHHYIFTSRGALDHELFIDGISIDTNTAISKTHTSVPNIGLGHWNGIQDQPSNKLWDFRIYSRGITPREAYEFYNPATRWDLYHELGRRTHYFVAAGAPISSIGYPGGMLMGM